MQGTQTATPANGASYAYKARWRLSSRTVTQSGAPAATTFYVYDLADHLIAEVDASGQTRKEYIWLDDLPVAVVDQVSSANPAIYYVAVDHLMRPLRLMAQDGTRVWQAKYAPFGATTFLYSNPVVLDARFPGQWFQLETGLAYNWHRHYDASTGRYVQPDPLVIDDAHSIMGVPSNTLAELKIRNQLSDDEFLPEPRKSRSLFPDGPSLYGYTGQGPLARTDRTGLGWFSDLVDDLRRKKREQDAYCSPGDCTEEHRRDLQERVENACGAAKRCLGGESPEVIAFKIAAQYACIAARRRINFECYAGGDEGHNQEIANRERAIANCYKLGGQ